MAMKSKNELKDVFSGLSSIYIAKNGLANFTTVAFDYDMPVTVDSLSMSVSEPTLNRTKVHGLQADWSVTATPGELSFSATVPTINQEMVKYFMGEANAIATSSVTAAGGAQTFKGFSTSITSLKIYMGVGLLSEDGQKLILIKKMAVYATPLFENASTTPFGFKLTGTIEAADGTGGGEDDDIAFLTRSV